MMATFSFNESKHMFLGLKTTTTPILNNVVHAYAPATAYPVQQQVLAPKTQSMYNQQLVHSNLNSFFQTSSINNNQLVEQGKLSKKEEAGLDSEDMNSFPWPTPSTHKQPHKKENPTIKLNDATQVWPTPAFRVRSHTNPTIRPTVPYIDYSADRRSSLVRKGK